MSHESPFGLNHQLARSQTYQTRSYPIDFEPRRIFWHLRPLCDGTPSPPSRRHAVAKFGSAAGETTIRRTVTERRHVRFLRTGEVAKGR